MVNIPEIFKSDSEFFSDIATLLQTARSNRPVAEVEKKIGIV
jgi:hypothetical protein